MVRLSIGIEVDPQEVVQATFALMGSPTWVRLRGPQPLAVHDTLEIETVTGTHCIRGSFARRDAEALRLDGVLVMGLDTEAE
jgi:hypothetical protein